MKLLSVVIPCYNSQDYMRNCIESLLLDREDIELIIVNDGSVDRTAEIADHYAIKHPSKIKAIHQPNGGHGEAINTGLEHATGLYFKVVDSDDWVDTRAYLKILDTLNELIDRGKFIDLLISNFVYEKEGAKYKKVMKYTSIIPQDTIFAWEDTKPFRKGQYLMMHSLIYRTQLLRELRLSLPSHTFYVDNLYVYQPLTRVESMYYLNVDFYRYFIGRDDQSVNEKVMISRIDQQLKVNKMMIDYIDLETIQNERLQNYLFHQLEIVTTISSILLIRSREKENLKKKKELLAYIKERDKKLYRKLRYGFLGQLTNLPSWIGRRVSVGAYKISRRIFGFN
ncbi:glycosyltransferase [Amphibacillus sp. MSJ-3]|uniref:glycosyltransferase family 2 protein n=1 Tax=Amphibacillus sp. MSJ-3 TaxID=2841505 RepID=UPI001C0F229C|nr:glycosyltransferase [Amphibacillus sp. MSJ-3]MBU5593728.1 glycosyltransferase [Amphibacillus sp. MSJ-3]